MGLAYHVYELHYKIKAFWQLGQLQMANVKHASELQFKDENVAIVLVLNG